MARLVLPLALLLFSLFFMAVVTSCDDEAAPSPPPGDPVDELFLADLRARAIEAGLRMERREIPARRQALAELGREAYDFFSCSHCHDPQRSFFSRTRQALGPSLGTPDGIVLSHATRIDAQPVTTPTSLNADHERQLHDGRAHAGELSEDTALALANSIARDMEDLGAFLPEERGYAVQALVALQGHDQVDSKLLDRFNERFGERLDALRVDPRALNPRLPEDHDGRHMEESAALLLACFQATLRTYESPFQQWLRDGDHRSHGIHAAGLDLFLRRCVECHSRPGGGGGFAEALGPDLEGMSFQRLVRIPQLGNLRDRPAFGHGGNWATMEVALLEGHALLGLIPDEAQAVADHLLEDRHDARWSILTE